MKDQQGVGSGVPGGAHVTMFKPPFPPAGGSFMSMAAGVCLSPPLSISLYPIKLKSSEYLPKTKKKE